MKLDWNKWKLTACTLRLPDPGRRIFGQTINERECNYG